MEVMRDRDRRQFLSEVPGVTMLRLDLGLQGLDGSVSSASGHGHAFSPSQAMVTDTDYRERIEAGTLECADDPRLPARDLLDRLFASLLSESQDPFTRVALATRDSSLAQELISPAGGRS